MRESYSSAISRFLAALESEGSTVTPTGANQWKANCPAHADRTPTLSVKEAEDGRVLVKCFSGCEPEQIVAEVGMTMRDLFDDNGNGVAPPAQPQRAPDAAPLPSEEELTQWVAALQADSNVLDRVMVKKGWSPETLADLGVGWDGEFKLPIRNAQGELDNVVTYLPGGEPKSRALRGRRRNLFPAPETIKPEGGELVLLVEGEGDALTAREVGLKAVGVPGTGGWKDDHVERLRRFERIAVIADCDAAGRKFAVKVASDLAGAGVEVRVLDLEPNRSDGYDLTDFWVEARGDVIEDDRAAARKLIVGTAESAKPFEAATPTIPENGRTNRTVAHSSHEQAGKAFGRGGERLPNADRTPAPALAVNPAILDRFDEEMGKLGLVGERATAKAIKLVHVSRLLPSPSRAVVKGDSSTGKSFGVECALKTCAPEGLFVRSQTSPLALFYSEEDFRHRTIVFYEANKLGDDDDPLARVVRTLLSEGKLAYEVTNPDKRRTELLEKEGPVAFITTTCKPSLDKEIETRILSLHSDNSDEQTRAVVRSILEGSAGSLPEPDLSEWHELDRWLRDGPREVDVPWGATLGAFDLSGPPRLRRDITNLISLVKAHALLHRATREIDERGRIIATLDDYEVVSGLLAEALAVATDKAVRKGTRAIVDAVANARNTGDKKISLKAAARLAGRSPSTTHTDVHDALERGYLVNLSDRDNRFDLDFGEPMPAHEELLPSRADLEARVRSSFADRSPPRPNARTHSSSQERQGVRSVRSISDMAGGTAEIPENGTDPDYPPKSKTHRPTAEQMRTWEANSDKRTSR